MAPLTELIYRDECAKADMDAYIGKEYAFTTYEGDVLIGVVERVDEDSAAFTGSLNRYIVRFPDGKWAPTNKVSAD